MPASASSMALSNLENHVVENHRVGVADILPAAADRVEPFST